MSNNQFEELKKAILDRNDLKLGNMKGVSQVDDQMTISYLGKLSEIANSVGDTKTVTSIKNIEKIALTAECEQDFIKFYDAVSKLKLL